MTREPWEDVVAAEDIYLKRLGEMKRAGFAEQMRLALRHEWGRRTAFRILMNEPPEATIPFVADIFPTATSINGQVGFARDVINRLDSGWLFIALRPLIADLLDAPIADDDDYQRLAEALDQWDQHKHLADLVERAAKSDDPHTREVADRYRRDPYPVDE